MERDDLLPFLENEDQERLANIREGVKSRQILPEKGASYERDIYSKAEASRDATVSRFQPFLAGKETPKSYVTKLMARANQGDMGVSDEIADVVESARKGAAAGALPQQLADELYGEGRLLLDTIIEQSKARTRQAQRGRVNVPAAAVNAIAEEGLMLPERLVGGFAQMVSGATKGIADISGSRGFQKFARGLERTARREFPIPGSPEESWLVHNVLGRGGEGATARLMEEAPFIGGAIGTAGQLAPAIPQFMASGGATGILGAAAGRALPALARAPTAVKGAAQMAGTFAGQHLLTDPRATLPEVAESAGLGAAGATLGRAMTPFMPKGAGPVAGRVRGVMAGAGPGFLYAGGPQAFAGEPPEGLTPEEEEKWRKQAKGAALGGAAAFGLMHGKLPPQKSWLLKGRGQEAGLVPWKGKGEYDLRAFIREGGGLKPWTGSDLRIPFAFRAPKHKWNVAMGADEALMGAKARNLIEQDATVDDLLERLQGPKASVEKEEARYWKEQERQAKEELEERLKAGQPVSPEELKMFPGVVKKYLMKPKKVVAPEVPRETLPTAPPEAPTAGVKAPPGPPEPLGGPGIPPEPAKPLQAPVERGKAPVGPPRPKPEVARRALKKALGVEVSGEVAAEKLATSKPVQDAVIDHSVQAIQEKYESLPPKGAKELYKKGIRKTGDPEMDALIAATAARAKEASIQRRYDWAKKTAEGKRPPRATIIQDTAKANLEKQPFFNAWWGRVRQDIRRLINENPEHDWVPLKRQLKDIGPFEKWYAEQEDKITSPIFLKGASSLLRVKTLKQGVRDKLTQAWSKAGVKRFAGWGTDIPSEMAQEAWEVAHGLRNEGVETSGTPVGEFGREEIYQKRKAALPPKVRAFVDLYESMAREEAEAKGLRHPLPHWVYGEWRYEFDERGRAVRKPTEQEIEQLPLYLQEFYERAGPAFDPSLLKRRPNGKAYIPVDPLETMIRSIETSIEHREMTEFADWFQAIEWGSHRKHKDAGDLMRAVSQLRSVQPGQEMELKMVNSLRVAGNTFFKVSPPGQVGLREGEELFIASFDGKKLKLEPASAKDINLYKEEGATLLGQKMSSQGKAPQRHFYVTPPPSGRDPGTKPIIRFEASDELAERSTTQRDGLRFLFAGTPERMKASEKFRDRILGKTGLKNLKTSTKALIRLSELGRSWLYTAYLWGEPSSGQANLLGGMVRLLFLDAPSYAAKATNAFVRYVGNAGLETLAKTGAFKWQKKPPVAVQEAWDLSKDVHTGPFLSEWRKVRTYRAKKDTGAIDRMIHRYFPTLTVGRLPLAARQTMRGLFEAGMVFMTGAEQIIRPISAMAGILKARAPEKKGGLGYAWDSKLTHEQNMEKARAVERKYKIGTPTRRKDIGDVALVSRFHGAKDEGAQREVAEGIFREAARLEGLRLNGRTQLYYNVLGPDMFQKEGVALLGTLQNYFVRSWVRFLTKDFKRAVKGDPAPLIRQIIIASFIGNAFYDFFGVTDDDYVETGNWSGDPLKEAPLIGEADMGEVGLRVRGPVQNPFGMGPGFEALTTLWDAASYAINPDRSDAATVLEELENKHGDTAVTMGLTRFFRDMKKIMDASPSGDPELPVQIKRIISGEAQIDTTWARYLLPRLIGGTSAEQIKMYEMKDKEREIKYRENPKRMWLELYEEHKEKGLSDQQAWEAINKKFEAEGRLDLTRRGADFREYLRSEELKTHPDMTVFMGLSIHGRVESLEQFHKQLTKAQFEQRFQTVIRSRVLTPVDRERLLGLWKNKFGEDWAQKPALLRSKS